MHAQTPLHPLAEKGKGKGKEKEKEERDTKQNLV